MWATRVAGLAALHAVLFSQIALAEQNHLVKRCRGCPLIVPECHACPDGQSCTITPNTCTTCPQAVCVAANGNSATGVAPLITTGFSMFPTMALPPGVTPTTVSPNEQTGPNTGVPVEPSTGVGAGTAGGNVPAAVTPSSTQSQTVTSVINSATPTTTSTMTSVASTTTASAASANQPSQASSVGGALKHANIPWGIEACVAALGLLAI